MNNKQSQVKQLEQQYPVRSFKFIDKTLNRNQQSSYIAIYLLMQQIGQGSSGDCFKVLKTFSNNLKSQGQQFALKDIKFTKNTSSISQKRKFYKNCQRQVQVMQDLKNLKNKSFIYLYNYWKDQINNRFSIVMQYCPNGSLMTYDNYLKSHGLQFQPLQTLYFAYQLLKALSEFHSYQYIHRDIKLANILLDEDMNIKICDFGLTIKEKYLTDPGVVGSPLYMAPEVIKPTQYNHKVDLWSLGVCLYYMTYNKFPTDKQIKNKQALYQSILNNQIKYFKDQSTQKAYIIEPLLRLMLQKNPQQRKSAKQLLNNHSIFKHIKGQQQQIKKSLIQKTNIYKIRVKGILHLWNIGYYFILQNQNKVLLKANGEIVQINKNVTRFINQEGTQNNQQTDRQLQKQQQLQKLTFFLLEHTLAYQHLKPRLNVPYINSRNKQVQITNINIIWQNVIMVKLSNKVIQFFFGTKKGRRHSLIFDTIVSLNYNNRNKEEISWISKRLEPNGKRFTNLADAMDNNKIRRYLLYIIKILTIQIDNTDISITKHGYTRI